MAFSYSLIMFSERDQILEADAGPIRVDQEFEMGTTMSGIGNTAALDVAEQSDAIAEVKQLIADLRDAAQDGRDLARRYGDLLQEVVNSYCHEFEQRAEAALARLEAVQ